MPATRLRNRIASVIFPMSDWRMPSDPCSCSQDAVHKSNASHLLGDVSFYMYLYGDAPNSKTSPGIRCRQACIITPLSSQSSSPILAARPASALRVNKSRLTAFNARRALSLYLRPVRRSTHHLFRRRTIYSSACLLPSHSRSIK